MKGEQYIVNLIRDRIQKKNQNFIGVWVGPPSSGKSWSALSVAKKVDPSFGIRRLVFPAHDFLDIINRDIPKGSVIDWDEAGLGMPAREWQSFFNKAVGYVLQSFRYRNLALLITVPDVTFLDRIPRSLFHYYFECIKVEEEKGWVLARPFQIQHNPRLGKTYMKHPILRDERGNPAKMVTMRFSKPPRKLREAYEERRAAYMKVFYEDLQAQAATGEGGDVPMWAWKLLLKASRGRTQAQLGDEIGVSREWTNRLLRIAKRTVL